MAQENEALSRMPLSGEEQEMRELALPEPQFALAKEVAPSGIAAAAIQEIQAAVILAKRFPRDEDGAFQKIIKSMRRPKMAEMATYEYPRGGQTISGPSIYLMREMARCWGNCRSGFVIIAQDPENVNLRAYAWDMETNRAQSQDATVRKLIQRKQKDGSTKWVIPDERDLRELVNNIGARAERNCIRAIMRPDYIEDAVAMANETLENQAAEDPEGQKKNILVAFGEINISSEMLVEFLGHPLGQASPAEITKLRNIFKTIRAGEKNWIDYAPGQSAEQTQEKTARKTAAKTEALKGRIATERQRKKKAAPEPEASAQDDRPGLSEQNFKTAMAGFRESKPDLVRNVMQECGYHSEFAMPDSDSERARVCEAVEVAIAAGKP